jgi:polar amino acid transport system substrate-binding protein
MKNFKFILIPCLTLLLISTGFATAATISIRADSWPPYNDEPGSAAPGYMIEIAELIFADKGHVIDYQLMPWTRSLDGVRKGTYDAVVGTDSEESPDFVFPKESFGTYQSAYFVAKSSSWKYAGIESLSKVRLGIIDGYGYYEALDNYIEKNKKTRSLFAATGDDALPKLLKMLKAGRIDAIVEDVNVMRQVLQEQQLVGDIVDAGLSEESSSLAIAFSPAKASSGQYARIFDEGIVKLRKSGKLQEILARYGLNDWN